MPLLFIHACDSGYHARDEGAEYDTSDAALAMGVKSAVAMATEEIGRGSSSAAVEVSVEQEDGTCLLRSVVAVSVSSLMTVEANSRDGS